MFRSLTIFFLLGTMLLSAAESKQLRKLNELSRKSSDRLAKFLDGMGNKEAEKNINLQYERASAFFRAMEMNRPQNVKLLIQYGADVSAESGIPSFDTIMSMCKAFDKFTKLAGFSSNSNELYRAMEALRFEPIAFIARTRNPEPERKLELQILKMLLEAGANPNSVDPINKWTPIIFYLDRGFEEAVDLLLDYNVDLTSNILKKKLQKQHLDSCAKIIMEAIQNPRRTKRKKKVTVDPEKLFSALKKKENAEIRKIIDSIKNINDFIDSEHNTVLIYAVISGNPDAVREVLARNPMLDIKNDDRLDAILIANKMDNKEILELLTRAGAKISEPENLEDAIMQGRLDQVKNLLAKIPRNKRTSAIREMLPLAVQKSNPECFQYLVEYEKTDLFASSREGKKIIPPPIFAMLENGSPNALVLVLNGKFPVNLRHVDSGKTLLGHLAASKFRKATAAIAKILLSAGANPNMEDKNGETPLMSAAKNGDAETVSLLLKANAFKKKKDKYGYDAMKYARDANNPEIVQLLQ